MVIQTTSSGKDSASNKLTLIWSRPWGQQNATGLSWCILMPLISLRNLLFSQVIKLHIDLSAVDGYLSPALLSLQYLLLQKPTVNRKIKFVSSYQCIFILNHKNITTFTLKRSRRQPGLHWSSIGSLPRSSPCESSGNPLDWCMLSA